MELLMRMEEEEEEKTHMRLTQWVYALTTLAQGVATMALLVLMACLPRFYTAPHVTAVGCMGGAFVAQAAGVMRPRWIRGVRWLMDAATGTSLFFVMSWMGGGQKQAQWCMLLALIPPLLDMAAELVVGVAVTSSARDDGGVHAALSKGDLDILLALDGAGLWRVPLAGAWCVRGVCFALGRMAFDGEKHPRMWALWGTEAALTLALSAIHLRTLCEWMRIATDPVRYEEVFYTASEDALPPGVFEIWSNFPPDEEASGLTVTLSRAERLRAVEVRHMRANAALSFGVRVTLVACAFSCYDYAQE
jgi:hypothetical protein